MQDWMQNAIVGACVFAAVLFLWRRYRKKSAGGCGSCQGCAGKRCP